MLKVAVVTHYFPTSTDPWAGHSAYQTLRLLSRVCEVRVFCSVVTYPRLLKPRGKPAAPDMTWRPGEVDVTYVPYVAVPLLSRALNGFTIARKMLPHVRDFSPDVILNYVVYPHGFAAVRVSQKVKAPVVLTAIGSDLNRIADRFCRILTRYALRRAEFVTTVSNDLARTALALGASPQRTRAILNGCDTTVFYPRDRAKARAQLGLASGDEIIVFVGRLDLRKGLLELIESIARLRTSHPRSHCYIIGDGPAKPQMLARIAEHEVADAVTLIPSCATDQVALWMAAADLITLPSYNEGCPNVVVEALSSGRPVVATRVGGIPELMDEASGRLVPPRDVGRLAEALHEVLTEPWDAMHISQTHSRGWADVAQDLLSVFEQVLKVGKIKI